MPATSVEMSGLMLVAKKMQNCFQMIISQLITSAAFVQFHLLESLFAAVGAGKHAAVKKGVVFQIDKMCHTKFC